MKKRYGCLLIFFSLACFSQTEVYAALSANNVFTGSFAVAGSGVTDITAGNSGTDFGSIQTKRVSIPSINSGQFLSVSLTWTNAWTNSSYTPTCSVLETTSGTAAGVTIDHFNTQNTTTLTVIVHNGGSGTVATGVLNCIAFGDLGN